MDQEYRRVYNMLKPIDAGIQATGFVKLEARGGRCAITVSLQGFRANERAPLRAYLASRDVRKLVSLGDIAIDHRGQGSAHSRFDGGFIEGLRLSEYDGVCVMRMEAPPIPLMGGSIGHGERLDWKAMAMKAARSDASKDEPKPASPKREEPEEPSLPPEEGQEPVPADAPPEKNADLAAAKGSEVGEFGEEGEVEGPAASQDPGEADVLIESNQVVQTDPAVRTEWAWPERAVELRALFERSQQVEPFQEDPAHYVRIAMPAGIIGVDHYIMGIILDEDAVKTVRYGVPGSMRATPPPGLEGYRWKAATHDGGYWMAGYDAATGQVCDP